MQGDAHVDTVKDLNNNVKEFLSRLLSNVHRNKDWDNLRFTIDGWTHILGYNEDEDEIDYWFRAEDVPRHRRDNAEKENIYGSYGWASPTNLINDEFPDLLTGLEEVESQNVINENLLEEAEDLVDFYETQFYESLSTVSIGAIEDCLIEHNLDRLGYFLESFDEDERITHWSIFFSWDNETDSSIPNDISIQYKDDTIMLARIERETTVMGLIFGVDDTPERFFAHRINKTKKLEDPNAEWTREDVRERMGFELDADHDAVTPNDAPIGKPVRMQGDLSITRYDYEEAVDEYYQDALEMVTENAMSTIYNEHSINDLAINDWVKNEFEDYFTTPRNELLPEIDWHQYDEDTGICGVNHRMNVNLSSRRTDLTTDILKDIQSVLGIEEDTLREMQDERDWGRLTAKRRRELIETVLTNEVREAVLNNVDCSDTLTTWSEIEEEAQERINFEGQNLTGVLGNHVIFMDSAVVHPNDNLQRVPVRVIVPEKSSLYVVHDEHQKKSYTLERGVYEFDFLDQHSVNEFFLN